MIANTQSIRDLRQWLCWRVEERDGKPTKACVRDGLAAREQEELIERLEALEGALEQKRGGSRWGA